MSEVKERLHYEDLTGRLTIERVQDVEPILEANKRAFNDAEKRFKSETLNHVARVPLVVLEKWAREKGISYSELLANDKLMARFLNDPDNRHFRTKPGRL